MSRLKKHREDIFRHSWKLLCFEDFLQLKLGLKPSISYSLAARTAAFNTINKKWSEKILTAAGQYSSYNEAAETAVEADEIIKLSNNFNKLYSRRYRIYKNIYETNKELLRSISSLSKSAANN